MAKKAVKWIPTDQHLNQIVELASHGVSEDNIAITLGITPACWYNKKHEFPELVECVRLGRAKAEALLANELWDIATNSAHRRQLDAIKFSLERRHKWSEKVEVESTIKGQLLDIPDEDLDKLAEERLTVH